MRRDRFVRDGFARHLRTAVLPTAGRCMPRGQPVEVNLVAARGAASAQTRIIAVPPVAVLAELSAADAAGWVRRIRRGGGRTSFQGRGGRATPSPNFVVGKAKEFRLWAAARNISPDRGAGPAAAGSANSALHFRRA